MVCFYGNTGVNEQELIKRETTLTALHGNVTSHDPLSLSLVTVSCPMRIILSILSLSDINLLIVSPESFSLDIFTAFKSNVCNY